MGSLVSTTGAAMPPDVLTQAELQAMMQLRFGYEKINADFERRIFEIQERVAAGATVERGLLRWDDARGRPADRTDTFYYRRHRKKPNPEPQRPFLVKAAKPKG